MRGCVEHFKITSVWSAASCAYERVQTATCGKCGASSVIHDAGGSNPKPVSVMAEKFRQKGWLIAPRPGGDRCPRCTPSGKAGTGRALTPGQKRAAFCRIADVPRAIPKPDIPIQKPKEAVMSKPAAAPVSAALAAPPRSPTREDRRKILDALDDGYLVDKGCYAGEATDQSLADRLKVPRAWVAEERERAFGPDACEADGADGARLTALMASLAALEQKGLAVAEEAEGLRRDCHRMAAKLAARGVA